MAARATRHVESSISGHVKHVRLPAELPTHTKRTMNGRNHVMMAAGANALSASEGNVASLILSTKFIPFIIFLKKVNGFVVYVVIYVVKYT